MPVKPAKKKTRKKTKKAVSKKSTPLKLTLKERKLLKFIAEGNPIAEAGRLAGYAESTCEGSIYTTLGKPRVQSAFQKMMEDQGLTDDSLLVTLKDGLKAMKVISANVINKAGDGMEDAHSMTKDFIDVEDHPTRHKFLETALKLKDHYPSTKVDLSGEVDVNQTELSTDEITMLKKFAKEYASAIRN